MQQNEEGQYLLFKRERPEIQPVPWNKVLAFSLDGAKSATQRAIERLGMLQTPTLRVVEVSEGPHGPVFVDQFGQLRPALCFVADELHETPMQPGNAFEVLDGRRRATDSFNAGDPMLAALVLPINANERTVAAVAGVLNIARKPSPLQEARSMQRLINLGMDREQIADTLGLPLQTIKKRLRLLELPPVFQQAIEDGSIKTGVAERIANLPAAQIESLKAVLREDGSVKGRHIKEVQEARKEADLDPLESQLNMDFEWDDNSATSLSVALQEDAESVLVDAAIVLMRDQHISFTYIRTLLSEINSQIKAGQITT